MEYNNTYLSDDDEIDIEMEDNINIELDQYGMPIEEIDEEEELELMRIINSKKILNTRDLNIEPISPKPEKELLNRIQTLLVFS